jgi:hypothetical protein
MAFRCDGLYRKPDVSLASERGLDLADQGRRYLPRQPSVGFSLIAEASLHRHEPPQWARLGKAQIEHMFSGLPR